MDLPELRTQKEITPRLIIEAVYNLWKEHPDGLSHVTREGKDGRKIKVYGTFKGEWIEKDKVFKVETRKTGNFGTYLKTLPEYKKKDQSNSENYWLYADTPEYTEALFYLVELGLVTLTSSQVINLKGGEKGRKGLTKKVILFHLGPFRTSTESYPTLEECLDLYEEALSKDWNPLVPKGETKEAAEPQQLKTSLELTNYIPEAPEGSFVGELRASDLAAVHERVTSTKKPLTITGMGGMGKSVLAREYLLTYAKHYPDGICWLDAISGEYDPATKETDTTHRLTQLIDFAQILGISLKEVKGQKEKIKEFWRQIGDKKILIILDDIKNGGQFKKFLPDEAHKEHKATIIGTSRMSEFGTFIETYSLELPPMDDALTQLKAITGDERIETEQEDALALLGPDIIDRLPLAVRLLGCYLRVKKREKLSQTIERIRATRDTWEPGNQSYIGDDALEDIAQLTDSQKGARAIFELTWGWLQCCTQKAAKLLPLFSSSFVDWDVVEAALNKGYDALNDIDFGNNAPAKTEGELILHSLISATDEESGTTAYTYHDLIGSFIKSKTTADDKEQWLSLLEEEALKATLNKVPHITQFSTINDYSRWQRRLLLLNKILNSLHDFDLVTTGKGYRTLAYLEMQTDDHHKPIDTLMRYAKKLEKEARDSSNKISENKDNYVKIRQARLENYYHTGEIYLAQFEPGEAIAYFEKASKEAIHKPLDDETQTRNEISFPLLRARSYVEQAKCLSYLIGNARSDKVKKVESLLKDALEIQEDLLGANHYQLSNTLNQLAALHIKAARTTFKDYPLRSEKLKEAYSASMRSLDIQEKQQSYNIDGIKALYNLGVQFIFGYEYEKAIVILKKAIDCHQEIFGELETIILAKCYKRISITELYKESSDYKSSFNLFEKARHIYRNIYGSKRWPTLRLERDFMEIFLNNGGDNYLNETNAADIWERLIEINEITSEHAEERREDGSRGSLYEIEVEKLKLSTGHPLPPYEHVADRIKKKVQPWIRHKKEDSRNRVHNAEAAEKELRRVVEVYKKLSPSVPIKIQSTLTQIIVCQITVNRPDKAIESCLEILEIQENLCIKYQNKKSTLLVKANILHYMAYLYCYMTRYKDAESCLEKEILTRYEANEESRKEQSIDILISDLFFIYQAQRGTLIDTKEITRGRKVDEEKIISKFNWISHSVPLRFLPHLKNNISGKFIGQYHTKLTGRYNNKPNKKYKELLANASKHRLKEPDKSWLWGTPPAPAPPPLIPLSEYKKTEPIIILASPEY